MLFALGPSLVGARVFASTDLMLPYAPWQATQSATATPDNPCVSDPVDGFLPSAALFRRSLLHGDLPLWDDLASSGTSFGAVPSFAVWSPLSVPYLVLPTSLAPAWVKLLEVLASGGGMFLFLRRLRLARAPALLGGLVFTTSGFMVSWTNWPQTRTAAFIPLLFWSLERLVQVRTARAVVPVALVVASLLLGGFPAVTGFALYLAAPYLVLRAITSRRRGEPVLAPVRPMLLGAVGVALGALAVAFQLLPFASQVGTLDLSTRHQSPSQHLPLLSLVTAALPNAFGSCPGRDYVGPISQIEVNAYAGTAVLVLAVLAVLRSRRRETPAGVREFFVLATGVIVLLGWVGGHWLAFAQHFPVFSNNPVGRIRAVLGLCLAVLAAMGYDALLRRQGERRQRQRQGLELGVWAVLAVAAFFVVRRLRSNLRPTGHLHASDRQTLYAALATAVVMVAVVLVRGRWRRIALGVVPLVVLVQALDVVLPFWPQLPRDEFYPSTPAHAYLADHLGHERFQGTGLSMFPGTNVYYGLRSLGGHSFTADTWRQLFEVADPKAFRTSTFSSLSSALSAVTSPALDRFSVRYVVNAPDVPAYGPTVTTGPATGQVTLPGGGVVDVPLAGGPLRGAGLVLATAPGVDGDLLVEVRQGARVLASSGRRLLPKTGAGDLPIALAGEGLPTGPLTLRIRNTTKGPVALAAAAGRPVLALVRPEDDGLRVAQATPSATVWERTRALPRLRWASIVTVATEGPASLKAAGARPALAGTVVLPANPDNAQGAAGTVTPLTDGPDTRVVRVKAAGAGYLVVADGLQDNGWKATVDGHVTPLLDADHAGVAVAVPEGTHVVRLVYAPKGLKPGIGLSLLGLVALLGLWLTGSTRFRRLSERRRGSAAPAPDPAPGREEPAAT